MDYFYPPFYMYDGVSVLRDYADKEQFYYYPNYPHFALDEKGRPAIRFIIFKQNLDEIAPGDEQAVGFLYFDTSLDWPVKTLDKVASKIQNDLQLDQPPRLAPLPYKSGTVRLVFLDRETQPPADPGQPGGQPGTGGTPPGQPAHTGTGTGTATQPADQKWVMYLESSGVPSLYGDERAIFNAMLTKKATQLLYSAFDGFIPAGVIYQLNFQGMQRAFNIHASVDWEQVYKYLEENFQVDVIFYSSDTDNIVSKLEEKKIINLTASLEGVGAEGMEGEFNAVRKEIQDLILDKFFKPAPNPNKPPDHSTVDGIVDAARRLRDLGVWGSVGYTRINYRADEIRTLDIDYTVARAVERTIAPQAHLSLFFSDFNLTKDQVVTVVDGEDALWKDVSFDMMVDADFARDAIDSVSLDVYYGLPQADTSQLSPTWSYLFNSTNTRTKKAAWYNPDVGVKFQYRYTVIFSSSAPTPGPSLTLSSGWQSHEGNVLVITPSQKLYKIETVLAQIIDKFPFDRYPQVQVFMHYQDPATNWSHDSSQLLSSNNTKMTFTYRTGFDSPSSVDYRCTFFRADDRTYDVGWQSSTSDLIAITDPIPAKLSVLVVPSGDRSAILNLIVDLKYDDDKNNVHETGKVAFSQETINTPAQPWVVQLMDPEQRRYSYSATLVDTSGNVITTGGWVQDDKATLTVGVTDLKRWRVQPQLVGPQLSDQRLESIVLDLKYNDADNNYTSTKRIVFEQPGIGDVWQLMLKDPSARTYDYTVTYNRSTGFTQTVGPIASSDTFLTISSIPPAS